MLSSHRFNIGDVVRRINEPFSFVKVGDINTVSEIITSGDIILKGYRELCFSAKNFELVKLTNPLEVIVTQIRKEVDEQVSS